MDVGDGVGPLPKNMPIVSTSVSLQRTENVKEKISKQ